MLYLDYAKQTEDGYIMNFFANSAEDLEDISEGKEFVTKNGTNYGVPAPQSVVTITNKDGEKTTYLMGEDGNWIPGVVNPTDYYTKKQVDAKLEGKEGKITDINLTETGTTITYDATNGITLNSTARLTSNGTETHDSTMKLELPIVPATGSPIKIDKAAESEKVEIGWDTGANITTNDITVNGKGYFKRYGLYVSGLYEGDVIARLTYNDGGILNLRTGGASHSTGTVDLQLPSIKADATLATTNFVTNSINAQKFKTLFGDQSITGTGNIDLYKHNVSLFIPDNISLSCNIYSSSNTEINTKELLITLAGLSNPPKFGDPPSIAAYGWYKKENDVYAIITQITNDYFAGLQIQTFSGFDKSGMDMIEFPNETITDTVTAI